MASLLLILIALGSSSVEGASQDYAACMILQGLNNSKVVGLSPPCSNYTSDITLKACTNVQPAIFTCDATNSSIVAINSAPMSSKIIGATLATDIGSLTSLTSITLSQNSIGGSIPTQIGSLANLAHLDLSSNMLNRALPPQVGNLLSLTYLFLDSNSLTGTIPPQIGSLIHLVELDLGVNKFTGTIPSQLGQLVNLKVALNLDMNSLQGAVPLQIFSLQNLQRLELFGNNLISLGTQIGQMTALTVLELESNSFGGAIPSTIGYLTNLVELGLRDNSFSGGVPSSFCSLTNLVELTLCDSNSGNAGCPYLTSVPQCIYAAPASSLSRLDRNLSTLGSLQSTAVSSAAQEQSGVTIAVLSVIFCLAYIVLIWWLHRKYYKPLPRIPDMQPIYDE